MPQATDRQPDGAVLLAGFMFILEDKPPASRYDLQSDGRGSLPEIAHLQAYVLQAGGMAMGTDFYVSGSWPFLGTGKAARPALLPRGQGPSATAKGCGGLGTGGNSAWCTGFSGCCNKLSLIWGFQTARVFPQSPGGQKSKTSFTGLVPRCQEG